MNKLYILGLALVAFSSCKKETVEEYDGMATLSFDARVADQDFALEKEYSIGSNTYTFSNLRYWISNVKLHGKSGSAFTVPASYFLIEETKEQSVQDGAFMYPATKRENIEIKNIPVGEYTGISFSVGVDSKYNDNLSLQSGELSQLNGMTNISWMWHTTYIFSTLRGEVTQGGASKSFIAETGMNANYKTVELPFPSAIKINSNKSTSINLKTDVSKILDGVDVFSVPMIGANESAEMSILAGNFQGKVFSVAEAK